DARGVTLTGQDGQLRLDSAGAPLMLQDNRVFGSGELEFRVAQQSGEGRAWPAGQTETVSFTLDLGGPITLEQEAPITLQAGADWTPLDLKLDIKPGSALDLSALNPEPAGSRGRVVARPDGHFGFEKAKEPVRFYGANLCYSANYL